MKMIKLAKENKGYSLVEMIIVIAIIAVMSAAAMVTVTLINSAKAKEAGVTFDSELAALVAESKSQVVKFDINNDGAVDDTDTTLCKDYYFAIAVYQATDGKYYISHGYYKNDGTKKEYIALADENTNNGKGTCISSRVSIDYTAGTKNSGELTSGDNVTLTGINCSTDNNKAVVVAFDKAGKCVSGVGTYLFKKTAGNTTIDEVTIRANGSRQSN
jgi:prepilin-type N-terminal cleavage/methylation domain-containing protein